MRETRLKKGIKIQIHVTGDSGVLFGDKAEATEPF
jgi:hypothetical protein